MCAKYFVLVDYFFKMYMVLCDYVREGNVKEMDIALAVTGGKLYDVPWRREVVSYVMFLEKFIPQ